MRPEDYQPPLSRWSTLWRYGLMVMLSVFVLVPRLDYQLEHAMWWLIADLILGAISFVAVWWRRSHPVAVATFTNIVGLVSATSAGPSTLALVSLSTRRRWREIVPQAVLAFVCGTVSSRYFADPETETNTYVDIGVLAVVVGMMVAWGMYIGSRRELLASWRSRAQLAEDEQSAKVASARAAERARIAREMHDVLAHRISTVNMYAGALAFRDDLPPEQVRETATVIAETSHLALAELREVLGVLREGPGDAVPESPQAAATDIDALIDDNRNTGMRIEYAATVDFSTMPSSVGRTLYRCVQEALTNVRKHAPAATAHVRITGDQDSGIDLEVVNALPLAATVPAALKSGFGLVGLAERVELSGGRESHRKTADNRFVLRVWLPWQT
ncbi:sensor histidine kinase [Gordonia effusa]|uniref:sensor histidine kinase n=1 Tax=Gordonia effusa TaxID=263908 RepID=UPI0002F67101|nr:histidine kinase [Gordonia effusa]